MPDRYHEGREEWMPELVTFTTAIDVDELSFAEENGKVFLLAALEQR